MNYGAVKYCDIANGLGCRTVLFVSGCRNACKGRFQPETWAFDYGKPFDETIQNEILKSLEPSYVQGITLLGGDPFEEENQEALVPFMRKVKECYPDKNVWAYTGYVYDKDLIPGVQKGTIDMASDISGSKDTLDQIKELNSNKKATGNVLTTVTTLNNGYG